MDTKAVVASCIEYIEDNICDKISLDQISMHTGMSKYYLHRLFKSLTGASIMEYVQERKLTSSINALINTDMRVIDVALDYGFDYEQSYIRAFKKKFGCTPLKVRADKTSLRLNITEKINVNDILTVGNSITYRPYFAFMQTFNLVGVKHKIVKKSGDQTANTYGRDFFYTRKQEIKNAVNPQVYFGYTDWSKNEDGFIYYIPSVQVSSLEGVPEGMTGICIPAHKYVVFRFVGFFRPDEIRGRHVGRLLVQLYSRWIFNSGYEFADKFRFEYIDTTLSKDNYCEMYICQPIVEKKKNTLSVSE